MATSIICLSSLLRTNICCRPQYFHRICGPAYTRFNSNGFREVENANIDVNHSQFISQAPSSAKWSEINGKLEGDRDITEGQGKLAPTSSHLFKLILPLGHIKTPAKPGTHKLQENIPKDCPPPTVFLLHPSQPLSHVSRLIQASLAPATPAISFRSSISKSSRRQEFQWSESTDVGGFIRDAARAATFSIHITYAGPNETRDGPSTAATSTQDVEMTGPPEGLPYEAIIDVQVPTFKDRTRFLTRRLNVITNQLQEMEVVKRQCDREARKGARRMALGGFGMLVVYWGAVARLTFWDYGWDVMEPITYLSGLSTVICGYLWFLYQGREVSYSSVLDRSISARREALYNSRGLDIDRWVDLLGEAKTLKREIGKIAEDYDEGCRTSAREGGPG